MYYSTEQNNYQKSKTLLTEVCKLYYAGYLPIPIEPKGEKKPAIIYGHYKTGERPHIGEVMKWFRYRQLGYELVGLAVMCGGIEQLDFDNHKTQGQEFRLWCDSIPPELLRRLVIYTSPGGGYKVCWRYWKVQPAETVTLAWRAKNEAAIEHITSMPLLCPGGSPLAHSSGKPYEYVRGHLADAPHLEAAERAILLEAASALTSYTPPPKEVRNYEATLAEASDWFATGDFDKRATWEEVLEPHGWVIVRTDGEVKYWRRPGKYKGESATTNYGGSDLLYVFSSNAGFEQKGYCKWAAWAVLNCDGDFSRASKELARKGYGRANIDPLVYAKLKGLYNE